MEKLLVHGSIILICLCTLDKAKKTNNYLYQKEKRKITMMPISYFSSKIKIQDIVYLFIILFV